MKRFLPLMLIVVIIMGTYSNAYAYQYRETIKLNDELKDSISFSLENNWKKQEKQSYDTILFHRENNSNERIYITYLPDRVAYNETNGYSLCQEYADNLYSQTNLIESLNSSNSVVDVNVNITQQSAIEIDGSTYKTISYIANASGYTNLDMYCIYVVKNLFGKYYLIEYKYANTNNTSKTFNSAEELHEFVKTICTKVDLKVNETLIKEEEYFEGDTVGYIGPFKSGDRTIVPLKVSANQLNYKTMWNDSLSMVTLYKADETSFLTIYTDTSKKEPEKKSSINKYFISENEKEVFEVGENISLEKMREYFLEKFEVATETTYTLFDNPIECNEDGTFSGEKIITAATDYVQKSEGKYTISEDEQKIESDNSMIVPISSSNNYKKEEIITFFGDEKNCIDSTSSDTYKLFDKTISAVYSADEDKDDVFDSNIVMEIVNNNNATIKKYPVSIDFSMKKKEEKSEIIRSYSFMEPEKIPDALTAENLNKNFLVKDGALYVTVNGIKELDGYEYNPGAISVLDNTNYYTSKSKKQYMFIKDDSQDINLFPLDQFVEENEPKIKYSDMSGKIFKENNITKGIIDLKIDKYYSASIMINENNEIDFTPSMITDNSVLKSLPSNNIEIKDSKNNNLYVEIQEDAENQYLCKLIIYKPVENGFSKTVNFAFKSSVKTDVNATVSNGRTMLPIRVVGEMLGASVGWNEGVATLNTNTAQPQSDSNAGTNEELESTIEVQGGTDK